MFNTSLPFKSVSLIVALPKLTFVEIDNSVCVGLGYTSKVLLENSSTLKLEQFANDGSVLGGIEKSST